VVFSPLNVRLTLSLLGQVIVTTNVPIHSDNNKEMSKTVNGASLSHMDHPYGLPRGYSSGASSDSEYCPGSPEEINKEVVLAGWEDIEAPIGAPRVRLTSHDITTDMRHELVADGDLSKVLIRIEVSLKEIDIFQNIRRRISKQSCFM
jgi:hypothetical protein